MVFKKKVMAFKKKPSQAPPLQAPLEPRPPEHFSVSAPPGFAIPERRGWLLGGKK